MALKKRITKDEHAALASHFQSEYKPDGDGFVLDIEGDQEDHWRNKHRIAEDHRGRAESRLREAETERDNLRRGAIPKDDVTALEASWQTKLNDANTNHAAEMAAANATINALTVESTAKEVASIFMAPALAIPMIRTRLKTEVTNGVATTRVLDKNGQLSAMSIDDLKAEFKADSSLAAVLVGSKGHGGGGGKADDGGAGGKKELKDMNDKERTDFARNDPAGFRAAVAAQKSNKGN